MQKPIMIKPVCKLYPLNHYKWGDDCDGWTFVENAKLSVKEERMPAGSLEVKHYHKDAQQFFYILKGVATFEMDAEQIELISGEGLHILPGTSHRISNKTSQDLEFLLCSQPSTIDDRIKSE
ncbi:MAG: cupin domain-containing protein [Chitinophagaceae bacterium]